MCVCEDGAASTDPRQKHTVATIDEGIIQRINTWSFRMWERGTETEMGWRLPFYNLRGIPTLSDCLTVLFWLLYSGSANLAPFPILNPARDPDALGYHLARRFGNAAPYSDRNNGFQRNCQCGGDWCYPIRS